MPLYLLDTNAISDLLRGDAPLRSRVNAIVPPDRLAIPTIVAGELLFGLKRMPDGARRQRLQAKLNSILTTLSIESIPELAATHYAEIKVFRKTAGRNLDEMIFGLPQPLLRLAESLSHAIQILWERQT